MAIALLAGGITPLSSKDRDVAIFSSSDVLAFTLEAPFPELFEQARRNADASVPGTLTVRGITIEGVRVSTRGHTSIQPDECTFPKLKLRFEAAPPDATPFAGLKGLKIGTHCGDAPGERLTPKFGRLANDKSPFREALAYQLVALMEVPTLRSRRATITYMTPDGARSVHRAMLLEDDGEAVKRFGATSQIDPERFDDASSTFATGDSAKLAFAEAMIGNFDWCLKFSPDDRYRCDAAKRLWNILALQRDDGPAIPVMYDFDLAGVVVGWHDWFPKVYNDGFVPSKSHPQIEVLSQLQRTRSLFSREELDQTRRHFLDRKDAALRAVAESDVDALGKEHFRDYLTSFFDGIDADETFYRPVVVSEGTKAFADSTGGQLACGDQSIVPAATPVSPPLARDGRWTRVVLLDALWHWAPPVKCDAVKTGSIWLDAGAISPDYPR